MVDYENQINTFYGQRDFRDLKVVEKIIIEFNIEEN